MWGKMCSLNTSNPLQMQEFLPVLWEFILVFWENLDLQEPLSFIIVEDDHRVGALRIRVVRAGGRCGSAPPSHRGRGRAAS